MEILPTHSGGFGRESRLSENLARPEDCYSIVQRIRMTRRDFEHRTGLTALKLFLSINLCEELLVEMLPALKNLHSIKKVPGAPNEFDGMIVYKIVESDVCVCSL